jgi:hypothetical protein
LRKIRVAGGYGPSYARSFEVAARAAAGGSLMKPSLTKKDFAQLDGHNRYARIAAAVGCPGGARAVGQAAGANPVAFLIPCHRAKRRIGRVSVG